MNVIATPLGAGGRTAMKEINVIGTMQLLAACQKAPTHAQARREVDDRGLRLVARATRRCSPRTSSRARCRKSGYAKDAVEVEGYVRGFGRRRPDVTLTLLRFTNFIGPAIDTPLTRYFSLPVVPTVLGFDPRLQLCHEDDGIEVLRRCDRRGPPGHLQRRRRRACCCCRRRSAALGRPSLPVPSPAVSLVARAFRGAGVVDFSPEQMRYLEHGRVVDITRLREAFGWSPAADRRGLRRLRRRPPGRRSSTRRRRRGRRAAPARPADPRSRRQPVPPGSRSVPERSATRRLGDVVPLRRRTEPAAAAGAGDRAPATPATWERKLAGGLAFLRRRLTGDYEVDEFGFDPDLTDHVLLPPLRPLYDTWFRVETRGLDNVPDTGGALVVANHSGTIAARRADDGARAARPPPGPPPPAACSAPTWSSRCRSSRRWPARPATRWPATPTPSGCSSSGELVGVWPEGFKGIGKPFSERYKLQRFGRGGFVSAALRTGAPIIPCSIVGAEEIYPMIGNAKTLARLLGLPYFPITPTFPLLGPLGAVPLPSKWIIEFGEPIETADLGGAAAADDPMLVFNLTDQVRETIQPTLYTLLMQRRSVFF